MNRHALATLAAISAITGAPPIRRTSVELKALRKSGNRTSPERVQLKLLVRAAEKRDRRRGRNLYNALA